MLKKIVIIGPESTGKSTLCKQLAEHFNTEWVPEYARAYLLKKGTNYTYENLLDIAIGQLELEDRYAEVLMGNLAEEKNGKEQDEEKKNNPKSFREQTESGNGEDDSDFQLSTLNSKLSAPLLFIDTDMYVMKVWCEFVFGKCHDFILKEIATRKYDLYLLCKPDLPWVKDELREYPDLETRNKLYYIYKDILINQTTPWVEISGNYDERLQKAVEAVKKNIL